MDRHEGGAVRLTGRAALAGVLTEIVSAAAHLDDNDLPSGATVPVARVLGPVPR